MNINEIVCTAKSFRLFSGFFRNSLVASLIDSKMEDVMTQTSSNNLTFQSIDIHFQSTKSESTIAVMIKILTASYSNKLINIHDSANSASLFPYLTLLKSCRLISH